MNRTAIARNQIYNKLSGFSADDLKSIIHVIDEMRKEKRMKAEKTVKLEGVLEGVDVDFSELKMYRRESWKHLELECRDE